MAAMSLKIKGPLLLAGAGNMGFALLSGWLERGLDPGQVIVQDPAPPPQARDLLSRHGVIVRPVVDTMPSPPAVLVLAVKPQMMDQVVPALGRHVRPRTVVLSIAAGRTIHGFEQQLPKGTAVVRAMPNTPASVGRGITAAFANAQVTDEQRALCHALLSAVGEVVWVDHEDSLDAVTAVSGSGPAYVFHLAECLAEAGVKAGLEPELAKKLARWTVAGAGELLHRSDLGADVLRQNVTSPNGTTFAALQVLMGQNGLAKLMAEAVAAAARRSRELAR
jgi:pyrroline-5-carboxylate reductase